MRNHPFSWGTTSPNRSKTGLPSGPYRFRKKFIIEAGFTRAFGTSGKRLRVRCPQKRVPSFQCLGSPCAEHLKSVDSWGMFNKSRLDPEQLRPQLAIVLLSSAFQAMEVIWTDERGLHTRFADFSPSHAFVEVFRVTCGKCIRWMKLSEDATCSIFSTKWMNDCNFLF